MRSRLLVINYHYIRDPEAYRFPGIHPISFQAFAEQVALLKTHFHFPPPKETEDFLLRGKALPRESVFLTFDDGLVDHWFAARDLLEPLGITGAFFVCSRPSIEGRALTVNKVHWLRAHIEPERFCEEFYSYLPRDAEIAGEVPWAESARSTYVYDTPQTARLKYALNFILPPELVDGVTTQMLVARGIDEREFCRQTYMSDEQILTLAKKGHVVGLHGHSHLPFSRLGGHLSNDIKINRDYLARTIGSEPSWISYPYGRKDAVPANRVLTDLFGQYDLRLGFTLLGTWNQGHEDRAHVRRINTNEVEAVVGEFV